MNAVQKGPTKTRWGDREGRRRDILNAAASLLEESAFQDLSMRVLAERSGVSTGTLYLYFRTKEEIFLTLYHARIERLRALAERLAAEAQSIEELIRRFADEYFVFYQELGRHLNLWALMADPKALEALPEELILKLREQVVVIFLLAGRRMQELAEAEGLELVEPERALPFLWMTLSGLADGFSGVRAKAQPFSWPELSAYAAAALARGLTRPRAAKKRRRREHR